MSHRFPKNRNKDLPLVCHVSECIEVVTEAVQGRCTAIVYLKNLTKFQLLQFMKQLYYVLGKKGNVFFNCLETVAGANHPDLLISVCKNDKITRRIFFDPSQGHKSISKGIRVSGAQYVVIDCIQKTQCSNEDLIELIKEFPETHFILISRTTGKLNQSEEIKRLSVPLSENKRFSVPVSARVSVFNSPYVLYEILTGEMEKSLTISNSRDG